MKCPFFLKCLWILGRAVRYLLALVVCLLSSCAGQQAPAFPILGAYFPAWIACSLFGIVIAIIARIVFIRFGIDDALPIRLLIYVCLALAAAALSSLLIFAH
ncbi:YtcA family lipoprotein [Klebsiella pneumoniae]|nr:YtcA family lipoprotein [Klebsiella pneumoniae]EJN1491912.1 hypothetical protein [Klebsiella pneumoniae]EKU0228612.1 hypothetical protein [Klebsiella pneumoniae]EKZ6364081.1 hypothetical protein [Klebsiella pneumoniae]EKZ6443350.1 hypothetical protein [Klebsiella pneumoniae]MBM1126187.1 hypothetical protein [Klebsiella pneumoniae]